MDRNMNWTNDHPVSHVVWVPTDSVRANDYNPNTVAPKEMQLLRLSIESDGFTQPIVVWESNGVYEVVDGFHRHIVGKQMGLSHLPVVIINATRCGKGDRMASTVRHNRARGKHTVTGMSDIVVDLARRKWDNNRIGKELGMGQDEVLRLQQVSGLSELFVDRGYSEAWEPE